MIRYDRVRRVYFAVLVLCLFGNVVSSARHDCQRLCNEKSTPKICRYSFEIGISKSETDNSNPNSNGRIFLSVNKKWPPPLVEVCQNDSIVVEVKNRLPLGIETALHWHGFTDSNSPYMDGVPMITQCPIVAHQTFTYHLKAAKPGTFFYRSQYVVQQLDGLFGPLVVRDHGTDQVHRSQTVVISPLLNDLQTMNDNYEADKTVVALQIAVYDDPIHGEEPEDGTTQRLRVINAAALNCPVTLVSPSLPLTVVAVDGNNVKPKKINRLTLNPDDRIDFLASSQILSSVRITGQKLCGNLVKVGISEGLSEYKEPEAENSPTPDEDTKTKFEPKELESLEERDLSLFLPYDVKFANNFVGKVDFRFKLGGITPYAPSYLTNKKTIFYQTYNKTFLYPPSPLLSQPGDVPEDILCGLMGMSDRCINHDNDYCECLGVVNLPYNKNLDLFLIDEGSNGNESQIVHVHGHSFYVLGSESYGRPITAAEIVENDKLGKIRRNLIDPIKKDSIVVPNKGFVILRLKTTRTGTWLIESPTSKAQSAAGFEFILNVRRSDEEFDPPKNFPKCGTLKGPDLVIMD